MVKKRWLACVLALVMLLSVLPIAAMAAEPVLDGVPAAAQQTEEETPAPAVPEEPKTEEPKAEEPKTEQPQQPQPQLEAEGEENAPVVMAAGTYYWAVTEEGKLILSSAEYTGELYDAAWKGTFTCNANKVMPWLQNEKIKAVITSAEVTGKVAPTTTYGWFMDCSKLASVDLSGLDMTNLTAMHCMFQGCKSLKTFDVSPWSNWDTSKVTSTRHMFSGCSSLTSMDLSGWDTSSLTSIRNMFEGCSALTSLTFGKNWNTSQVTRMDYMFSGCSSLTNLDVSDWNTSNVLNMYAMFEGCSSLTSLGVSKWDTAQCIAMASMFAGCSAVTSLDISEWDTSSLSDSYNDNVGESRRALQNMFDGCCALVSLKLPSNLNTKNVCTVSGMFKDCKSLTELELPKIGPLNNNLSYQTSMGSMFEGCTKLAKLDASKLNVSGTDVMNTMFKNCKSLTNLDFSSWRFTNAFDPGEARGMFDGTGSGIVGIDFSRAGVPKNFYTDTRYLTLPDGKIAYVESNKDSKNSRVWVAPGQGMVFVTLGGVVSGDLTNPGTVNVTKGDGTHFQGWYTAETGGERVTTYSGGNTYYARWGSEPLLPDPQPVYIFMQTRHQLAEGKYKAMVVDDAAVQRLGISYNGNVAQGWATIGKFESASLPTNPNEKDNIKNTPAFTTVVNALKADNFKVLTQFDGKGVGRTFLASGLTTDTLNKITWTDLHYNRGTSLAYTADSALGWKMDGYLNFVKVTFDYNDGKTASTTGDYAVGESITLPTPADREGYTFIGWKANGTAVTSSYSVGDADVTLQAQWTVNQYDVTFDPANGAEKTTATVNYGDSIAKPANPTKTGYTFDGWYNGSKKWDFTKDTMGAANMTLTAHWTINQYDVVFNSDGGSSVPAQKVNYNEKANKPADPTRSGYVFDGWYNGSQKFDFSSPITGNVTLTAKWHLKTNNIGPAKNPYIKDDGTKPDAKTNGKTVKSGNTFDAGIGLYVGMSLLSLTGSALVVTKKKRG